MDPNKIHVIRVCLDCAQKSKWNRCARTSASSKAFLYKYPTNYEILNQCLLPLHQILQNRLQYLVIRSPCTLTDEQLTVTEEELAVFGEEQEQDQEVAFDDEDVVDGRGVREAVVEI